MKNLPTRSSESKNKERILEQSIRQAWIIDNRDSDYKEEAVAEALGNLQIEITLDYKLVKAIRGIAYHSKNIIDICWRTGVLDAIR